MDKKNPSKAEHERAALWLLGNWLLERLDPKNPLLLEGKALEPKDLCILANTNQQVDQIKDHLTQLKIPLAEPFTSNLDYQQALADFLSALETPWDEKKIGSFLARTWFDASFDQFSQLKETDRSAYKKLLHVFHVCHQLAREERWVSAFRHFFAEFDFALFPLAPQGEDFFAQLEAKLFSLQDGGQTEDASELATGNDKKNPGVFVSTIHQAKGLEFPIVLTPYLWSQKSKGPSLVERLRSNDCLIKTTKAWLWSDLEPSEALYSAGANYDAYCRLYVSLTRAKLGNVIFLFDQPEKASKARKTNARQFHQGKNQSFVLFERKQQAEAPPSLIDSLRLLAKERFSSHQALPLFQLIEQGYTALAGEKRTQALLEKVFLPKAHHQSAAIEEVDHNSSTISPFSRFLASELMFRLPNEPDLPPNIQPTRRISFSYTSLKHRTTGQEKSPEEEELLPLEESIVASFNPSNPITLFPKGRNTGIYIHELFAQFSYDFTHFEQLHGQKDTQPELSSAALFLDQLSVEQRLACFFPVLNEEQRSRLTKASYELLGSLAGVLLDPKNPNSRLGLLPRPQQEWQFNLFCPAWPPSVLDYIFDQVSLSAYPPSLYQGFLYGALDAIFAGPAFVQIVDWKTDYLGDQTEDYRAERLAKIAGERGYFLESYLYQYALAAYFASQGKKKEFLQQHQGLLFVFTRALPFQQGTLLHQDRNFITLLDKELPNG